MRLLFIVPNITSYRTFLAEVSATAQLAGHEVHVACSTTALFGAGSSATDATTFHPLTFPRGMNPLGHLRAARQLDALVAKLRPDLIHAHFSAALFTTAVARRSHWPVTIGTFHGMSFPLMPGLKGRILRIAESWTAGRFDCVWVLTRDDRDALLAAAPTALVAVHRSSGIGCALDRFDPDTVPDEERAALRKELGIAPDDCVFVFVGRFVKFKGFDLTVRSFLQLAPANPRMKLLLVGPSDPLHPTGLTPAEEEARRGCPQIIETGHRSDVWRYLAISDAMVFPSQREGMPCCAMEALAMGLPVITSDSRGCRDVVRDGIDGIVLRQTTVEAMSGAILRLAKSADLRIQMGAAAFSGRRRFSRADYVREQLGIYEDQVGGYPARLVTANAQ
jgi:glycosyltransferase involved in cell wall biosynthesis